MTTETNASSVEAEVLADLEAVLRHVTERTPVEPELARRVRARSEAVQAQLRRTYGELNVAVELVRAVRDEE